MTGPYEEGTLVTWTDDAPATWRRIYTPGPMTVISARWHDGTPTEYARRFGGGFDFKPGWRITVEYPADSTTYYDPPLSILLQRKTIRTEIHEMWLKPAPE